MARSIGAGPFTVHGDVAFPLNSTDAILRDGDLVMVDSGIIYEGYASDFGRTWLVGRRPTARQVDHCKRWQHVVAAVHLRHEQAGQAGHADDGIEIVAAELGAQRIGPHPHAVAGNSGRVLAHTLARLRAPVACRRPRRP